VTDTPDLQEQVSQMRGVSRNSQDWKQMSTWLGQMNNGIKWEKKLSLKTTNILEGELYRDKGHLSAISNPSARLWIAVEYIPHLISKKQLETLIACKTLTAW